uniref:PHENYLPRESSIN receptor (Fragments) n=1 Tax=Macropus giganteus TaxID=9317 RepID=Q9TSD1_MACGI
LPVVVLIACYSLICYEICKNLKGTISRAKIRTVMMTFVIVLAY